MLAPRRVPPCLMASVAASKTSMKEIGPLETPVGAERTTSFVGRSAREGEARPAAALVDQGGVLDRLEDAVHRVLDRQHEAGGELLQLAPGVHQRGGVGQELEVGHQPVELSSQTSTGAPGL